MCGPLGAGKHVQFQGKLRDPKMANARITHYFVPMKHCLTTIYHNLTTVYRYLTTINHLVPCEWRVCLWDHEDDRFIGIIDPDLQG